MPDYRDMPGYRDFAPRQGFQPTLALSPDAGTVAYSSNAAGRFDLWTIPVAGGVPRRLTRLRDGAVRRIAWAPHGKSLVFTADRDGDEQYRLYRVDLDGDGGPAGVPAEIGAGPRCQRILPAAPFDAEGRRLVYAANDRDETVQDVLVRDLAAGTERRVEPPPGVVFRPAGISPDGRWLLTAGFRTQMKVAAYLIDLRDASAAPVCVTADHGDGLFEPGPWASDSSGFYLRTDLWGEFVAGAFYRLETGTLEPVAQHDWDVESIEVAGDTLVWSVNQDGCSTLYARHAGRPLPLPAVPPGVVSALALAPQADPLVVLLDTATRPADIAVLDAADGVRRLTDARPRAFTAKPPDAGRPVEPVEPEPVVYASSAGRYIHALYYRPHAPGPHPVLLSIHGGPEAQERPEYVRCGLYQYLLARGIAVFAPNIAGSTGYGARHQRLVHRNWGGFDLDDLDHAVCHLRSEPGVDVARIAVMGGAYGGFAALSCLARLPYRWAAGVSLSGPANLVALARSCPPTWRPFVAAVLGDPDTDAGYLTQRSPITYADTITAPLFVLQGARDPRVPPAESDRLVDRLRSRGVDVRYEVLADEGHAFTDRETELRVYEEIAEFLCDHLLGESG
ncbi:prolyl oligopeptidase family serine peptidase [Actinomadura sp. LD22]|uniref:Prolyl oligopeptidase family serine peptidase n=1 Tax=Actinomadura physcomitrii TaxID=2650748 RepID=A0A6I4M8T3_9ACTN|nr:prolyl oligopeptidase family serine peptidase [Actinomadura physcomitrii]MVZ99098.1 prolyl oligopeptidase family serine peptidase [Actinomadura physcomitrii]